MRRALLPLALLLLALVLAACGGSTGPGWTYAPPTPPPPSQPAPSGAPSAAPSSAPSAPASGALSAGSSDAAGTVVQVSAQGVAFEQAQLSAPAGASFVLHFNNKDAGIMHNVEIVDASGTTVFKGDFLTGAAEVDYKVDPLPAGMYTFKCTIHPNMTGMLMAGG